MHKRASALQHHGCYATNLPKVLQPEDEKLRNQPIHHITYRFQPDEQQTGTNAAAQQTNLER